MEDDGVIAGYAMLVDPAAIGRLAHVFVEITLKSQSEDALEAFEAAVLDCPDVMECHLMSGDADYLLGVLVEDMADYERVHKILARLPGVSRTRSSFVIRTINRRMALAF